MIIVASVSFALFFVEIHRFYYKWKLNFKPFNCASCLASWLALGLYFLPEYVTEIVLVMFGSGVIAPMGKFFLDKFYKWSTK
jgi:ABC-type thiamin/hydroxymethylpyrimidine transport system permease subunit